MDKELKERLEKVKFVVEANSFEQQMLWETSSKEGTELTKYETIRTVDWEDESLGHFVDIGKLNGRPLCLSLNWAKIKGQDVLFVDYISKLCDYSVSDNWLKENCPNIITNTNAMNFHNILNKL